MISKGLLSEVLKIENILEYRLGVNTLLVTDAKSHCGAMAYNIYELAHKCKEWANKKEYTISSSSNNSASFEYNIRQEEDDDRRLYWKADTITFLAETEAEAIFKACQWILDNEK